MSDGEFDIDAIFDDKPALRDHCDHHPRFLAEVARVFELEDALFAQVHVALARGDVENARKMLTVLRTVSTGDNSELLADAEARALTREVVGDFSEELKELSDMTEDHKGEGEQAKPVGDGTADGARMQLIIEMLRSETKRTSRFGWVLSFLLLGTAALCTESVGGDLRPLFVGGGILLIAAALSFAWADRREWQIERERRRVRELEIVALLRGLDDADDDEGRGSR